MEMMIDVSPAVSQFCEALWALYSTWSAPHVVMRPRVFKDGNAWCALYGEDLMEGVAGFGPTPEAACQAFDREWLGYNEEAPA